MSETDGFVGLLHGTSLVEAQLMLAAFVLCSLLGLERQLRQKENDLLDAQNKLIKADLRHKELAEKNLKKDLEVKSQELSTNTLYVIHKNQFVQPQIPSIKKIQTKNRD